MKKIKVVHLATSLKGGAGMAARRMNGALQIVDIESTLIGMGKHDFNPNINEIIIKKNRFQSLISSLITMLQSKLVQKDLKLVTPLSLNFTKLYKRIIDSADIIHIHAFFNLISTSGIGDLLEFNKPIFVTMHDERLFTGGCHYAFSCQEYKKECKGCPQVNYLFKGMISMELRSSQSSLRNKNNLYLISPSQWLAKKAESSSIFDGKKIYVLPNPVPDIYWEVGEKQKEKKIKSNYANLRVGFASLNLNNPYKGLDTLLKSMNYLTRELKFSNFELTLIGKGELNSDLEVDYKLRKINSNNNTEMAELLTNLDVLVVPSLQDNYPSVISESLMCGTKIIGSNVGGIPEMLENFGCNLFEAGDHIGLARVLTSFDKNYDQLKLMNLAKIRFGERTVAMSLVALYEKSLNIN